MRTKWQTALTSVRERNKYMYNSTLFSDVEFSVVNFNGYSITVPAHKYVLAITSPVFEAMFYGALSETSPINLPDCTADGLLELFRYMYYDEVELTGGNVMEVMYLAKKYFVPSLVTKCTRFLGKELGPEDVFSVLPQAITLGEQTLEQMCWDIIDSSTSRVVLSDSFLRVPRGALCDILTRETLNVMEVELFLAVDRWAENRVNRISKINDGELCGDAKRRVLGDEVIHLIRFPLMTMEQLLHIVLPTGILSRKEVHEIVSFHYSNANSGLRTFELRKRNGFRMSSSCKRFPIGSFERRCESLGQSECVSFKASNPVHVTGVRLCGSPDSHYTVKLAIYTGEQRDDEYVIYENHNQFSFTTESEMVDGYYGFVVELEEPVCLEPGAPYTIQVLLCGPKCYLGRNGLDFVHCEHVTFTFIRQQTRGIIAELLYCQRLADE